MAARYHLETREVVELAKSFSVAGKNVEAIVNDLLHTQAGAKIKENIMPLLPASEREWKGKRMAARRAEPFLEQKENLAITVVTKTNYNYLYFPDDGSNTERHAGNQQFMYRGAENATPDIVKLCTAKIIERLGG